MKHKINLQTAVSIIGVIAICSLSKLQLAVPSLQESKLWAETNPLKRAEGDGGDEKSNLQFPKAKVAHLGFQTHPTIIPRKNANQTGPKYWIIPITIAQLTGIPKNSTTAITIYY